MLPDRVSNPGPLTYESGALPIALRGPVNHCSKNPSGGQDKPAGIGCPPPIIEGILSD